MTKEDILAPFYKQNKNGLDEWVSYEDALSAMSEYGKQQCIAFMNWTLSSECDVYQCTDEDQWTNVNDSTDSIPTEQLYEIYLKQQSNDTMGI
jgi:hypothetical protein